jgi:hypothetical protein
VTLPFFTLGMLFAVMGWMTGGVWACQPDQQLIGCAKIEGSSRRALGSWNRIHGLGLATAPRGYK